MKSQDIFLLLKLICLQKAESKISQRRNEGAAWEEEAKLAFPTNWEGWEVESDLPPSNHSLEESYSRRGLQSLTGISKTEIGASLKRSISVGLAIEDRSTGYPKVNTKALLEFISYGLKYVFPAKPAEIIRGIPTSFAAPVMEGKLMTAGEHICVWPDPHGNQKGQSIAPLFKSVPAAVKKDPSLYELLALTDAIRIGNQREAKLAIELLRKKLSP